MTYATSTLCGRWATLLLFFFSIFVAYGTPEVSATDATARSLEQPATEALAGDDESAGGEPNVGAVVPAVVKNPEEPSTVQDVSSSKARQSSQKPAEMSPSAAIESPAEEDSVPLAAEANPEDASSDGRPPRQELGIQLRDHPHVKKYLDEYQRPFGLKWLNSVLATAAPYRVYVRQQLEAHGLPACLEYLPVIESEYKTSAKSRSGALGIWQFMENSIAPFLIKNEWVDERLDPWKSTDAAIKKLQDNYRWFNSWELALAAYNYGAGGISRLIKRNGGVDDYWHLVDKGVLSNQTELYVPKFLAVAELVMNEAHYGLEFPKADEKDLVVWDEVVVTKSVPLAGLAKEMDIDFSILKFLNPALLRGRTPPATEYTLRVPAGTGDDARKILQTMHLPVYEHTYTVVKGDTLWGISRRYGISVQDLCDANNIDENGILSIGKTLYVPIIE